MRKVQWLLWKWKLRCWYPQQQEWYAGNKIYCAVLLYATFFWNLPGTIKPLDWLRPHSWGKLESLPKDELKRFLTRTVATNQPCTSTTSTRALTGKTPENPPNNLKDITESETCQWQRRERIQSPHQDQPHQWKQREDEALRTERSLRMKSETVPVPGWYSCLMSRGSESLQAGYQSCRSIQCLRWLGSWNCKNGRPIRSNHKTSATGDMVDIEDIVLNNPVALRQKTGPPKRSQPAAAATRRVPRGTGKFCAIRHCVTSSCKSKVQISEF